VLAIRLLFRLPPSTRRRLVSAVPARWRLRLLRAAGRASGERPAGRPPSWSGRATPPAVVDATSPIRVRRDNLTAVMAILDAAAVPYHRVPSGHATRTALAVPAAHRPRALAALTHGPAQARAVLRGWDAAAQLPARIAEAAVVSAYWPVTNPGRTLTLAEAYACDVEFWTADGAYLVSPRLPAITPPVPADAPVTYAAEPEFGQFCADDDGARFPTRRELLVAGMDWVRFPVDAVYTWVDGGDPGWQRRKAAALRANGWAAANPQAANASRYTSRDELRYSLRSLHHHAPWIRNVFLVTDAQVPAWLDPDHPAVTVIDHREIFGAAGRTPTFNSHAIESRLHHIPGLAEHFIYLNDDVFLGRPVTPDQFFLPSGIARFFESGAPIVAGPTRPDDPPVMAAGKNNRAVLADQFGRLLTRKLQHTPHPQRRSVLAEIEQHRPDLVAATAGHPFRHPDDLSLPSSLQPYWAYLTGRAVPGRLSYVYTDLKDPDMPLRLMALLRYRGRDAFCLNDTDSDPRAQREQADLLAEFLPAYFPFPAPFETAAGPTDAVARPRRRPDPVVAPPRLLDGQRPDRTDEPQHA
jgi:hypothetical protein